MKATETAVNIVLDVSKISTGMSAVKFLVKSFPASIGFVDYSRLKFSLSYQNTEAAF